MRKVKTGLLALAGGTIALVTLRKLRNRGSNDSAEDDVSEEIEEANVDLDEAKEDIAKANEDIEAAANDAKDEAITAAKHVGGAVKHVGGAVKHAGFATVKAIQSRRSNTEDADSVAGPTDPGTDMAGSK